MEHPTLTNLFASSFYRILSYKYPIILENTTSTRAERNGTMKMFLGAKVEYLGVAFGIDDTFSSSIVMCHTLHSSGGDTPLGSNPYLMVLPQPQAEIRDSSQLVLTVYGLQYISIGGNISQYAIKKKSVYEIGRKITMDIHMEENNDRTGEQDAWMDTQDGLSMKSILKESSEGFHCCNRTICEPSMQFHDEKFSIWLTRRNKVSVSWIQGYATLCVLSITILYFYSRVVIWVCMTSWRKKTSHKISPSKGWVRDDQQGRLCRASS